MTLNDWLLELEQAQHSTDPEVCTLPEDGEDQFSAAKLSLAITAMGAHARAGQFGYLQQLANNPVAAVARDALEQLKPIHPGNDFIDDCPEWEAYAAAFAAWGRLRDALPIAWLLYK